MVFLDIASRIDHMQPSLSFNLVAYPGEGTEVRDDPERCRIHSRAVRARFVEMAVPDRQNSDDWQDEIQPDGLSGPQSSTAD